MLALQFCLPFNKPLAACARPKLPELKNAPAGRSSPGDAALAARAHRDHGRVCRGHSDTTRFPPSPLASAVPGPPSSGTDLRHTSDDADLRRHPGFSATISDAAPVILVYCFP